MPQLPKVPREISNSQPCDLISPFLSFLRLAEMHFHPFLCPLMIPKETHPAAMVGGEHLSSFSNAEKRLSICRQTPAKASPTQLQRNMALVMTVMDIYTFILLQMWFKKSWISVSVSPVCVQLHLLCSWAHGREVEAGKMRTWQMWREPWIGLGREGVTLCLGSPSLWNIFTWI